MVYRQLKQRKERQRYYNKKLIKKIKRIISLIYSLSLFLYLHGVKIKQNRLKRADDLFYERPEHDQGKSVHQNVNEIRVEKGI